MAGFSKYDRELKEPLVVPQGSPISIQVVRATWELLTSHCRANRPHLGLFPETPCSSPVATGISGLHSRFTRGVSRHLELRWERQGSSTFMTLISGSLWSWNRGVRCHLLMGHGILLASKVVHAVSGHLLSCMWNLRLFPEDATWVSVPIRL